MAETAENKGGFWGDVLLGASLGPIFSTCSPTYVLLFSTILPINLGLAVICMIVYVLGFGGFLAILVKWGRGLIKKFYKVADNRGGFKKILGVILVITGVLIATGIMQKIEVAVLDYIPNSTSLEKYIVEKSGVLEWPEMNGTGQTTGNILKNSDDPRFKLLNANYKAPDITGLTGWINSAGYKSLDELKGKVVIIDFWTYSCINCIRTLPYLQARHTQYEKDGLVIIWVHAPEFAFERKYENVKKASEDFGLTYPIVQDNDYTTWRAYSNKYRPAKYIIDREGIIRYTHFGEGEYKETEEVIQFLLSVEKDIVAENIVGAQKNGGTRTPETYLGMGRRANMSMSESKLQDQWWIQGERTADDEKISLTKGSGSIAINAAGSEVNLVLGSPDKTPINATIFIDGKETKKIEIIENKLYNLYSSPTPGTHKVEIIFDKPGVEAFAFTFG